MFDKTSVLEKLVHFARLSRATHNWDIYMYRPDKVGPDGAPHNVAPGLGLHLLLNTKKNKNIGVGKVVCNIVFICPLEQSDSQVGHIQCRPRWGAA